MNPLIFPLGLSKMNQEEGGFESHLGQQQHQNAVDCLVHCEFAKLQEQLAVKDERIAILEEKIISMSMELASAKSMQDHHQLLKRRSSIGAEPPQQQVSAGNAHQKLAAAALIANYSPKSFRKSKSTGVVASASPRLIESKEVDFVSWPQVPPPTDSIVVGVSRQHPRPKGRGGFWLSRSAKAAQTSALKSSFTTKVSLDDSAKESISSYNSSRFSDRESATLHEEFPARRRSSMQDMLDSSFTSVGQFILGGFSKNDKTDEDANMTEANETEAEDNDGEEDLSCCAGPNVIFPVSSLDCLRGLSQDSAVAKSRRRCSDGCLYHANVEWPEMH